MSNLSIIVAVAGDGSIGRRGDMPWHLPEDLKHFKTVTMGEPVIMGRKTWESLPKRPLPGRLNIVVTRNPVYEAPGAEVACSLDAALELCSEGSAPFIIGGATLYREAMPRCGRMFVTEVMTEVPDADTWFPEIDPAIWKQAGEEGPFVSRMGLGYKFKIYESRSDQ